MSRDVDRGKAESSRRRKKQHRKHKQRKRDNQLTRKAPRPEDVQPDYDSECSVCGQSPVVPVSGMCGPCTFGESSTAGGNW